MSDDLFRAQTKAIEFWDNYKHAFGKRSTSKEDVTKVSFGIGYDIGRKEAEAKVRELEEYLVSVHETIGLRWSPHQIEELERLLGLKEAGDE